VVWPFDQHFGLLIGQFDVARISLCQFLFYFFVFCFSFCLFTLTPPPFTVMYVQGIELEVFYLITIWRALSRSSHPHSHSPPFLNLALTLAFMYNFWKDNWKLIALDSWTWPGEHRKTQSRIPSLNLCQTDRQSDRRTDRLDQTWPRQTLTGQIKWGTGYLISFDAPNVGFHSTHVHVVSVSCKFSGVLEAFPRHAITTSDGNRYLTFFKSY